MSAADYRDAAARLRDIADRLAAASDDTALAGSPAPELILTVLPAPSGAAAPVHQAWVDVVGAALAGDHEVTTGRQPHRDDRIHSVRAQVDRVYVAVHAVVPATAEGGAR